MKFLSVTVIALVFGTIQVSALPASARSAPPLGSKTVFEACSKDADCQQGCCAFATGLCAGPDVAQTNADKGCGHGSSAPNCDIAKALGFSDCAPGAKRGPLTNDQIETAAKFVIQLDGLPNKITLPSEPPASSSSSSKSSSSSSNDASSGGAATSSSSSSKPLGQQFVTGKCTSDSDCQQGCCAFSTGLCAGPGIAQSNADNGCGFGQPTPNCQVATALNLGVCAKGGNKDGVLSQSQLKTAVQFVSKLDNIALPKQFQ